jgi:hypothetical protein
MKMALITFQDCPADLLGIGYTSILTPLSEIKQVIFPSLYSHGSITPGSNPIQVTPHHYLHFAGIL